MNAIDLLTKDHKHLKTLLARAVTAQGDERREEFIEGGVAGSFQFLGNVQVTSNGVMRTFLLDPDRDIDG